ncbi:MAG: tRNA (N(6)-L-threonylcarbamoyladenosine(37)-C(2))-methylthiotransferase MtaB [Bacteroidota bacterium]
MSKKIAFKTLGCRLNLFETDSLASEFIKKDYELVDFDDKADVYVINTCTVTSMSDQKSRRVINQAKRKNDNGITIVTGCMATNYKEQLEKTENIDYVVDNEHKTSVLNVVEAHFNGELVNVDQYEKDLFNYEPAKKTFHTRSFIKIQDGCDNYCTFCIIPKVRGRATSRPVDDVLENIRKVVEFGFKEIIITGVNIGRYSHDGTDFESLVEQMLEIPGDFRIRISSIEPDGYTDSFFRLFKHPKLAPHMHICLQSGSEDILLKMRRMYTAKLFKKMSDKLEELYPDFSLTTDIIVGFPGETEENFQETVDLAEKIGFAHIHTFKYSIRTGTRAERLPDHIDEKEKNRRSEIVRILSEKTRLNHRNKFIGKQQRVLVQKINDDGFATGYGEHYLPIIIESTGLKTNSFYDVIIDRIIEKKEPVLVGKLIIN